jgi:hypothetical protein
MITAKGKEEIHKLIASDLVESWSETDQKLRNVVKMLLLTRPDLIRLYFFPAVWQRITELDKRQAAAVILAALKAEVVAQAGAPGVAAREQARFYLETRIPHYVQMAETWCQADPDQCEGLDKLRRLRPLTALLPAPSDTGGNP